MRPNSWHILVFIFSISCLLYHFKISFVAQNHPFVRHCNHVITLPDLITAGVEKQRETLWTKLITVTVVVSRPEVYIATNQRQGGGWILRKACFLNNYIGTNDEQCRYIIGRCRYVCRTKQGWKTRALWGNSWYYWICDILISRCSTTEVVITEFNCKQTNKL
jgi:hypothetical protein